LTLAFTHGTPKLRIILWLTVVFPLPEPPAIPIMYGAVGSPWALYLNNSKEKREVSEKIIIIKDAHPKPNLEKWRIGDMHVYI